ncbi:hypothetical protein C0995_010106 [Termitomyces sp. Mi166|nr:hypothetical protein C0995_010106 [Termitomyces sp. Mi166\
MDLAQDALTHLEQLQQGSRSITDYRTIFFELKGKLGQADAESLSPTVMALVNTDYKTAEKARDILLRRESKLADIAAKKKGGWHGGNMTPYALMSTLALSAGPATNTAAHLAPPPALANPNAMDIDQEKGSPATKKCFKCGKVGHFVMECSMWIESIREAVREAVKGEPGVGFV